MSLIIIILVVIICLLLIILFNVIKYLANYRIYSNNLFQYYSDYKSVYDHNKYIWIKLFRKNECRFRYKVLNNNKQNESIKDLIYIYQALNYKSNHINYDLLLEILDDIEKYKSIFGENGYYHDKLDQKFQYIFILMFENITKELNNHKTKLKIQILHLWYKNKYMNKLPIELIDKIIEYL